MNEAWNGKTKIVWFFAVDELKYELLSTCPNGDLRLWKRDDS